MLIVIRKLTKQRCFKNIKKITLYNDKSMIDKWNFFWIFAFFLRKWFYLLATVWSILWICEIPFHWHQFKCTLWMLSSSKNASLFIIIIIFLITLIRTNPLIWVLFIVLLQYHYRKNLVRIALALVDQEVKALKSMFYKTFIVLSLPRRE